MGQQETPAPPLGDEWWPEVDTVGLIGTPAGETGVPGKDPLAGTVSDVNSRIYGEKP